MMGASQSLGTESANMLNPAQSSTDTDNVDFQLRDGQIGSPLQNRALDIGGRSETAQEPAQRQDLGEMSTMFGDDSQKKTAATSLPLPASAASKPADGGTVCDLRSEGGLGMSPTADTIAVTCSIRNSIRQDLELGRLDIPAFKAQPHDELTDLHQFPPALLPTCQSRHHARFDRSLLLPVRDRPFKAQIMEHVKSWAEWATGIPDDNRRKEVLDRVFEVLTNVWFEALRQGYDPGVVDQAATSPWKSTKAGASRSRKGVSLGIPRGKPRQKRDTSPSKVPVLISASHKNGPTWPVTAGELREARVTEEQVRKRASSDDLDQVDDILEDVLGDRGGVIAAQDWYHATEVTKLNPMGRNLFLYSLYEVLMSRKSIEYLQTLYDSFRNPKQKENTQKRIDDEEERHNLFTALALEIKELDSRSAATSKTRKELVEEIEESYSPKVDSLPRAASIDPDKSIAFLNELIRIIELVINQQEVEGIIVTFEEWELSDEDFCLSEDPDCMSKDRHRAKHALGQLLLHAREIRSLSAHSDEPSNFDSNVKVCERIEKLERQITQSKHLLGNLLADLVAERDAARTRLGSDAQVDVQDGDASTRPFIAVSPPPPMDYTASAVPNSLAKHSLTMENAEAFGNETPPRKKQKIGVQEEILNCPLLISSDSPMDNEGTEATVSDVEETAMSQFQCSQPSAEEPGARKGRYIKMCILPKVNQVLARAGMAPTEATNWGSLRQALKDAGASLEERDALVRELNQGRDEEWKVANANIAVTNLPGDATLGNPEPALTIQPSGRADASHRDNISGLSARSLVATLRLQSGFDPNDLSSKRLFSHKGFQYRYTPESTLAQRRSMDEVLDTYVRESKKGNYCHTRFGNYAVLAHQDDPERTGIIHGIWDNQDGSRVQGAEWFYDDDGMIRPGSVSTAPEDDKETEQLGYPQKKSLVNKHLKNVIRLRRGDSNWPVTRSPQDKKTGGKDKNKSKKKDRAGKGATLPSPLSQSVSMSATRVGTHSGTVSSIRPKRRTAARQNYADLNDSDDDEYYPSY